MQRREFLRSAGLATTSLALTRTSRLGAEGLAFEGWRTFEVVTRVEVLKPSGRTRVWVPAPLPVDTSFQKSLPNGFDAPGGTVHFFSDKDPDAIAMVVGEFPAGTPPVLTVTSRASTRDFAVDPGKPGQGRREDRKRLAHFLRPTRLLPTDGIVRETALSVTKGARTDEEKARALYEWIVENTFRDPKVRGCGIGDIRSMLELKNLGGKCADLNALYVGLARAAGVPARDVYGIRTSPSELGYKSLGASSATITKSQHCRAEVYLEHCGWVPVDPADVRKVALEEPPGQRPLQDPMVARARARLFGSWEMNWMAYNYAHDVTLPGSNGGPIGFLMYPQAETDQGRLDSLTPDEFKYEITAHEMAPAEPAK